MMPYTVREHNLDVIRSHCGGGLDGVLLGATFENEKFKGYECAKVIFYFEPDTGKLGGFTNHDHFDKKGYNGLKKGHMLIAQEKHFRERGVIEITLPHDTSLETRLILTEAAQSYNNSRGKRNMKPSVTHYAIPSSEEEK